MRLATARYVERRFHWRVSIHTFRWGWHYKLRRPSGRWFHFVVKLHRGSALGQTNARNALWIGWWRSERGTRGQLNGWRLWIAADRLPPAPRRTIKVPIFPQGGRDEERAA